MVKTICSLACINDFGKSDIGKVFFSHSCKDQRVSGFYKSNKKCKNIKMQEIKKFQIKLSTVGFKKKL